MMRTKSARMASLFYPKPVYYPDAASAIGSPFLREPFALRPETLSTLHAYLEAVT